MPPKPSEKRTRVSSSEEENLCHVDASDAILKDIQNKLEKLNESTDRIEERLVRIEDDMTSINGKVADLEKGLNSVNTEVAEMKQDIEKKADFEKLQMLEREVEELRNRSRRNNLVFYNVPEKEKVKTAQNLSKTLLLVTWGWRWNKLRSNGPIERRRTRLITA